MADSSMEALKAKISALEARLNQAEKSMQEAWRYHGELRTLLDRVEEKLQRSPLAEISTDVVASASQALTHLAALEKELQVEKNPENHNAWRAGLESLVRQVVEKKRNGASGSGGAPPSPGTQSGEEVPPWKTSLDQAKKELGEELERLGTRLGEVNELANSLQAGLDEVQRGVKELRELADDLRAVAEQLNAAAPSYGSWAGLPDERRE